MGDLLPIRAGAGEGAAAAAAWGRVAAAASAAAATPGLPPDDRADLLDLWRGATEIAEAGS